MSRTVSAHDNNNGALVMNDASIILAAALGLMFTAGAIARDTRDRIAIGRDMALLIPSTVLTERPTATMAAHERLH